MNLKARNIIISLVNTSQIPDCAAAYNKFFEAVSSFSDNVKSKLTTGWNFDFTLICKWLKLKQWFQNMYCSTKTQFWGSSVAKIHEFQKR